ncbi:DNA mismatch repair protein MutS [Pseudolabrys sp. Root1462]|uniref:DNA mismatch repair protein MutS n=1 Tax=Pseudolabrys sp. Root1462 TaxID=1736466 RepID=UPI000702FCE2|nr:DNA mismatch repair protein MutS [Pseudolabrys sp. Root1462]KQY97462.1 DNA mismatch repair protein MutS [Pseudolabrys sp. Root1462]
MSQPQTIGLSEPETPPDATPPEKLSPMLEQYIEIKTANPGSLLFYRMGDFYELFFEDAEVASRALGIVLTKRGKHQGQDIPMCGVPIHRSDEYLHRLIALGHRVAVCEQLEDPAEAKKRGSKSVVKRDVVRLVTPGTLTEDTLLDARRNNYLLAIARARLSSVGTEARFGLAWIDISTGEFRITECDRVMLAAEIARLEPGEILISDALYSDTELMPLWRELPAVTPLSRDVFDSATAERRLTSFFAVATSDGFGALTRLEITAAAAAVTYIERTQIGQRPPLSPPLREAAAATMAIDQATRGNLELMRTLSGERRGSLLDCIDRTVTAAGSRLLAQRLSAPLTDAAAIARRLDAVSCFVDDVAARAETRSRLAAAPDLARALTRIALQRGGPRDLAAIRDGIGAAHELARALASIKDAPEEIAEALGLCRKVNAALAGDLSRALGDDLPLIKRDGGFIREGYNGALDENRALRDESRRVIAALQARYCDDTGVKALKIKHNNVLGYFVEVTAQNAERMMQPPLNATFIHRQTLAGQVRFTSTELGELEAKIASAADRALGLELEIFERLCAAVITESHAIKQCAEALARLDVASSLAAIAVESNFARPTVDDSLAFIIEGGRHPVVEHALSRDGTPFVANDSDLSPPPAAEAGRIWLITGPNMAGKSTFLRQNALIAIMAQMGSFVPAKHCHIGIVDRLFSRVGAADDLARGRSTFMVEMVETAAILNQAGERALVILDEIGRGTATFDGLSIAWATIEHLHDINKCRSLFATHYHELTALSARLLRLHNVTVKVKEWNGEVVFLHEVIAGAADRSYGIQVAKLAGLPGSVIERAKVVLAKLEQEDRAAPKGFEDLPLFAANYQPPAAAPEPAHDIVVAAIAALNPDEMSPREAMEALYQLKAKLREAEKEKK